MAFSDNAAPADTRSVGTLGGMTAVKPGSTVTIYAIRCKRNGYRYVGATGNSVARRWGAGHKPSLRNGAHGTKKLQEAWDRFGEDAFVVEVLEEGVTYEAHVNCEAAWIDKFSPRVFNVTNAPTIGEVVQRRWVVTPPGKREFEVVNLYGFCTENELSYPCMFAVAKGQHATHKGWKCRRAEMSRREWERIQRRNRRYYKGGYRVTAPDGVQTHVEVLVPWARERGLRADCLVRVARGLQRHHRGYVAERMG